MRSLGWIVDIVGSKYAWKLQREPQWCDADGWKGMAVSLRQKDMQRQALLEFPAPKRLLKGLQRGRLQINDANGSRGIRAASRWYSWSMQTAANGSMIAKWL
jgi:hypothetical protein